MFQQLDLSTSSLAVGGLTLGIVVGLWSKIKLLFMQLVGLLIGSAKIYDPRLCTSILSELNQNGRALPGVCRVIGVIRLLERATGRRVRVVGDTMGTHDLLIWYRGRPLWVSRGAATGTAYNSAADDNPFMTKLGANHAALSVRWIRGTFNLNRMLIAIASSWKSDQSEGVRRYRHIYRSGTVGVTVLDKSPAGGGEAGWVIDLLSFDDLTEFDFTPVGRNRDEFGTVTPSEPMACFVASQSLTTLTKDCEHWLRARQFCEARGLPWRRGYLLHGSPGNGKSTAVRMLAQIYDLPVYHFLLGTMRSSEFLSHWSSAQSNSPCIVLLEDFDSVFDGRENRIDRNQGVSFDVVLNEIAGARPSNGILLVVTTNHPDIDEAMGRPLDPEAVVSSTTRTGRLDLAVRFSAPTEKDRVELANKLLKGLRTQSRIDAIVKDGAGLSMAEYHQLVCGEAIAAYWEMKQ